MFVGRQREEECSAAIGFSFGPAAAAMAIDDALNGRETDATSFEFIRRVKTLECSEKFPGVIHVESHSVVPNKIDVFRRAGFVSDFDRRRALLASEFDRIRKKILEDLCDQPLVRISVWERIDLESDFSVLTASSLLLFESSACDIAHIDFRKHELLTATPRQR